MSAPAYRVHQGVQLSDEFNGAVYVSFRMGLSP